MTTSRQLRGPPGQSLMSVNACLNGIGCIMEGSLIVDKMRSKDQSHVQTTFGQIRWKIYIHTDTDGLQLNCTQFVFTASQLASSLQSL